MTAAGIDVVELEQRVSAKFAAALAERVLPLDTSTWFDDDTSITVDLKKIPTGTPQFPRERWISYPDRRVVVLTLLDRLLDLDLTDEQWLQAAFLMQYGGRERIA